MPGLRNHVSDLPALQRALGNTQLSGSLLLAQIASVALGANGISIASRLDAQHFCAA